jgi:uncharacterized protein (DUF1778 family)
MTSAARKGLSISFRVSPWGRDVLREAARMRGITVSRLIREAALGAAVGAVEKTRSVTGGVTTAEDPLSRNGDPQPGRPKARAGGRK